MLLVPTIGFELMTYRLQGDCTTTVLSRQIGSPTWARTTDQQINSLLLYRLSYWGIVWMRDLESNQDLELMRLVNYRYSIPR